MVHSSISSVQVLILHPKYDIVNTGDHNSQIFHCFWTKKIGIRARKMKISRKIEKRGTKVVLKSSNQCIMFSDMEN